MIHNHIANNICPTCQKTSQPLLDWKFSGLNNSVFNYTAKFYECVHCGLVYIENISEEKLSIFYSIECDYHDKEHFDIKSPENVRKYQFYKDFIEKENFNYTQIADIGCGRGGFLLWLEKNGFSSKCIGVDVDTKSIPINNSSVLFYNGTATQLPFENSTQFLLTYFHVFEHIKDLNLVLQEANRVLIDNGYIVIEVPDASRYEQYPIGTAFWFAIREHIYHFTANALCNLLNNNGFEVIKVEKEVLPTPEFEYPSLMIMAKKSKNKSNVAFNFEENISLFLKKSKNQLQNQANMIEQKALKYPTLVFWGCSSEFFSLLPLIKCKNIQICDSSKLKQQSSYNNIKVNMPMNVDKNSYLIIAPYLYNKAIKENALALGWQEESIMVLI